jgi:hypothetical protein
MPPRFSLNTDLTLHVNAPLDIFFISMVTIIQRNQVNGPKFFGASQVCRNQSISLLVLKIGIKLIHPTLIKLIRSIYSLKKPFGDFGSNSKGSLGNFIAPTVFITKVASFTRGNDLMR